MKLRDPQDTILALALIALVAFLVVRDVAWAETIATAVVGGVLVMIRPGTPGGTGGA